MGLIHSIIYTEQINANSAFSKNYQTGSKCQSNHNYISNQERKYSCYEVTMNKTEEANQDLVEAVFSLSDGESKIKYKNEILTTSSVAVSDASGKQQGT